MHRCPRFRHACGPFLLVAGVAGCSGGGDSCDVPLDALSIVAIVTDDGHGVRAEVDLEEGDRTLSRPLRLCEEDQLRINGRQVKETPKFDRVVYGVSFDAADAPRTLQFTFEREGQRNREQESVEFEVTLREAFEILQPSRSQQQSRAHPMDVAWEPPEPPGSGATMQIELHEAIGGGICLQTPIARHDYKRPGGISVEDTGSWRIPANTISSTEELRLCSAELWLTRTSLGAYPRALEPSGYIQARVQRRVSFYSRS